MTEVFDLVRTWWEPAQWLFFLVCVVLAFVLIILAGNWSLILLRGWPIPERKEGDE